ncbi:MAG: CRISPR-associated endonuclease Cas2 [Pseudomonadota bacterium]|nr:CRISPR-associated endonuclease Cas2 [Pseudomonadota bacterium]
MPDSQRRLHLVCYDIANPRRLVRVHRCLLDWAFPVQYSVFIGNFNRVERDTLESELEGLIHSSRDDVRIYPLPMNPRVLGYGRSWFPDGVRVVWNGKDLLDLREAARGEREPVRA